MRTITYIQVCLPISDGSDSGKNFLVWGFENAREKIKAN